MRTWWAQHGGRTIDSIQRRIDTLRTNSRAVAALKEEAMAKAENKSVGKPDEVRKFDKGHIDLVNIGGGVVGKATFEPGWRWSEHVKPIAKTEWCEAPHFMYQISGRMHVKMADGQEFEMVPGDVAMMPSGHDAWVVGDEAVVAIDWQGATNYAKG
jgi:quercetin dioxygenase-like cupin family protein